MKKLIAMTAAAVGIFVLVACGQPTAENERTKPIKNRTYLGSDAARSDYTDEVHIQLDNGTTVTCLVLHVDRGGGISCDWPQTSEDLP